MINPDDSYSIPQLLRLLENQLDKNAVDARYVSPQNVISREGIDTE